jgi:hypothetical protein
MFLSLLEFLLRKNRCHERGGDAWLAEPTINWGESNLAENHYTGPKLKTIQYFCPLLITIRDSLVAVAHRFASPALADAQAVSGDDRGALNVPPHVC